MQCISLDKATIKVLWKKVEKKTKIFVILRVREKFSNPLVHRTTIIENLVARDPKVLVQKYLFKLYLEIKSIQHVAFGEF